MRSLIAAAVVAAVIGILIAAQQAAAAPRFVKGFINQVAAAPRFVKGFINPQLTASWDRWTIGGADSFITEGSASTKRGGVVIAFTNPVQFGLTDPTTVVRLSPKLIAERVTKRRIEYRPEGQAGRAISARETNEWNLAGGFEGEIGFRHGRWIVFAATGGEINERSWDIFYTLRPGWEATPGLRVFASADLVRWGGNGHHPALGMGIGINRR